MKVHRFGILAALCAVVLCVAGCGAVTSVLDTVFGVEEKVTKTTDPFTGEVKVTTEIVKRPGLLEVGAGVANSLGMPWALTLAGALAAFWKNARAKGADVKAAALYDKLKTVVAGIVSLVDGKPGDTFSKEDIYKAIDEGVAIYNDNSDEFRDAIARLKAEIRAENAKDQS